MNNLITPFSFILPTEIRYGEGGRRRTAGSSGFKRFKISSADNGQGYCSTELHQRYY